MITATYKSRSPQPGAGSKEKLCLQRGMAPVKLESAMLVYVKIFQKKSIIVKIIQDFHFPELLSGVAAKAS